ncbi:trichome birefringence-like 25-like protein [Drosera capensis]
MVKEMRLLGSSNHQWPLCSVYKQNPGFVKLVASVLVLGVPFCLFSSRSFEYFASSLSDAEVDLTPASLHAGEPKCDLFIGDWIPGTSAPAYTNETCPFIQDHQNCIKNGRPDSDYLHWRWKPRDCELPVFDPERFLDLMKNKSFAFIGDSIARNHVQSLLCTLSKVDRPEEIYCDKLDKSKTWSFPSYNFRLSVIWTPFLVKAEIFEDNNGVSISETKLHLDNVDESWSTRFKDFDYMIISAGKWFLKSAIFYENDQVKGCHYCEEKNNLTDLGYEYSYRKALENSFSFMASTNHKAVVLFRTTSPDHFEGGEWFSGGKCDRTVPFRDGEVEIKDVDRVLHEIELQEYEKAVSRNGLIIKLMDVTRLSWLRPDGHPGPYRIFHPFEADANARVQTDCLHWCLPGPIDSWNNLVMEILVNT